ncbi:MAG: hypothetical protein RLZZ111_422 [Planctomycetota bacterium]
MSLVAAPPPPAPDTAPAAAAQLAALRDLLAKLRRQTRGWIWIESLAWAALAVAAFFWGTLAVDWAIEPPRLVRGLAVVAALAGLVTFLVRALVGRLGRELSDASLAMVVERSHPGFRDALSTAIELAGRPAHEANPELLGRAAAEAVAHLQEVRPERIFRRRQLSMLAFGAAVAVASIVAVAVARPAVAALWARRLVGLVDDPWPRRVRLVVDAFPDGVRKVARGSDVDVVVHAQAADRIPDLVDLRWRAAAGASARPGVGLRGTWRTERMGARGGATASGQAFGHVLKAVAESLDLEIRGGDARVRGLRLEVLDPPAVAELVITATAPDYLGGGRRTVPPARVVQIPRGAAVEIACTSTKPLSAATIVAADAVGTARPADSQDGGEEVLGGLSADAARTVVGRLAALDADRTITVRLTDTDGLVNREPVTFTLSALPDEPPQVAVRMRGISTAVTPRGRLPLVGSISDDHGLGGAAIRLLPAGGAESMLPLGRVRAGETNVELPVEAPEVVPLEPLGLAVGGTLQIRVAATDTCTLLGGPNEGTSDTWSLAVVAPEALVAMLEAREIVLRRRYESCVADLTQARDGLAAAGGEETAVDSRSRLGEAAARAAGETGEIAEAFRGIHLEFDNNQLLTPELESRLIEQIASPLGKLAAQEIPGLAAAARSRTSPGELLRQTDLVLARMRAVLDKMMELESFNEVVELLRGMIRTQEQIRTETLDQQKRRAREALERP